MEEVTTLDRLAVGRRAAVTALSASGGQRRRLLELGFVPGGEVAARLLRCGGWTPDRSPSVSLDILLTFLYNRH